METMLAEFAPVNSKPFPRRKCLRLPNFDYAQPGFAYFMTLCVRDSQPLFKNDALAEQVTTIPHNVRREYGAQVYAYCLMPDYLHLVMSLVETAKTVPEVVRDFNEIDDTGGVGPWLSGRAVAAEFLRPRYQAARESGIDLPVCLGESGQGGVGGAERRIPVFRHPRFLCDVSKTGGCGDPPYTQTTLFAVGAGRESVDSRTGPENRPLGESVSISGNEPPGSVPRPITIQSMSW